MTSNLTLNGNAKYYDGKFEMMVKIGIHAINCQCYRSQNAKNIPAAGKHHCIVPPIC